MILFQALMILVLFSLIQPTTSRTAICWNFFYYPTDTTVKTLKCYCCKAAVTFNKASSSNLLLTLKIIRCTMNLKEKVKPRVYTFSKNCLLRKFQNMTLNNVMTFWFSGSLATRKHLSW